TPTPIPVVPTGTPAPQATPATPQPATSPTPGPGGTGAEVVYRADQSTFSADNAHLTWINAGPVDTHLTAGAAEIRLDSVSARMRGPASLTVTLVADTRTDAPVCSHVRMELQGTAPVSDGSAAGDEGMLVNFTGTLVRTFDGQN